jgi:hypothetical protein
MNKRRSKIRNVSAFDVHLARTGGPGPPELTLPARSTSLLKVNVERSVRPIVLSYTAANFLIGPEEGLPVSLEITGP